VSAPGTAGSAPAAVWVHGRWNEVAIEQGHGNGRRRVHDRRQKSGEVVVRVRGGVARSWPESKAKGEVVARV
jgi:hypothetical protein